MSWENVNAESRPPAKGKVMFACKNPQPANDDFGETDAETVEYTYPLKLVLPVHASSSQCRWVYPVTFGGGLVEGDNIHLHTHVSSRAAVLVTTQSSTKVFHCLEGKTTQQTFTCRVESGALLALLPDPVTCFLNARYQQHVDVKLDSGSANLVLLDWLSAGRVARGETWKMTSYSSRIRISLNEDVVFRDAMLLGDTPNLNILSAMKHYQVVGSLILLGPKLSDLVRSLLKTLGSPKPYGSKYNDEELVSISPLKYKRGDMEIAGCYIRIAAPSTSHAYSTVNTILDPLKSTLGGDPFQHKF